MRFMGSPFDPDRVFGEATVADGVREAEFRLANRRIGAASWMSQLRNNPAR